MALTQMQIIQSLGEAMAWFERELQWGVPATELRHLCGRIGELVPHRSAMARWRSTNTVGSLVGSIDSHPRER